MVMTIKISSMDVTGKSIILTAILKVTTTALKMTMMICGDCNVDGIAADFSCPYAYTMEYSALFIFRTEGMVGLSVFGKVIVGSIASGGLELSIRKPWDRVLSCHLRLPETMHMFICTNTLESDSCFEAGWNESDEQHVDCD
jgi:hypothetical protein